MVSRCSLLWLLLCPVLTLASSLRVETGNAVVEMGKSLSLDIIYVGNADPGLADLQLWQDRFFIERQNVLLEPLVSGEIKATEQVRLYPRQVGEQVLDAIALGGAFAKPYRVSVTPAVRVGIDAMPHWLSLPDKVWQGQVLDIAVEVGLLHPANEILAQEMVLPGFDIKPLANTIRAVNGHEIVTLHWRLIPRWKGFYQLSLPAIVQRGHGRWKFYLPTPRLEVLPLPGYLPPTVPVGRLSLRTQVVNRDNAALWQLQLSNNGPLPRETYGVRAAMAKMAGASPEDVVQPDPKKALYEVPVPSWSWGLGQGPAIALRYFDTETGALNTVTGHFPPVWRLPQVMAGILLSLGALLAGILLWYSFKLIQRFTALRNYRRLLAQAKDPHILRRHLLGTSGYLTLDAWAAGKKPAAAHVAQALNALCFAPVSERSFAALKQAAMRLQ